MSTTTKATGAAAKSQRQSSLSVVRPTDEQPTQQEQQEQQQPVNTQPATQMTPAENHVLKAQERAIREQLKAAKATQPKVEKQPKPAKSLDDVVAEQTARPRTDVPRIVAWYVLQREAAGQARDEALDEVLEQVKSIVLGALEQRQEGESYHTAIFRFLGRQDMLSQPSTDTSSNEPDTER